MKSSIFIQKMQKYSAEVSKHFRNARELYGKSCRVLFKISLDTEKELTVVSRLSHNVCCDPVYNDIFINSVAADITRYTLLHGFGEIVYLYNSRINTLSINLIIP